MKYKNFPKIRVNVWIPRGNPNWFTWSSQKSSTRTPPITRVLLNPNCACITTFHFVISNHKKSHHAMSRSSKTMRVQQLVPQTGLNLVVFERNLLVSDQKHHHHTQLRAWSIVFLQQGRSMLRLLRANSPSLAVTGQIRQQNLFTVTETKAYPSQSRCYLWLRRYGNKTNLYHDRE